ncbi:MAG TPA: transporter substrate-binding domain-containing protein [Acetobacteraceae bacterium]|nr:transporter substrate-binding domain-containing protein [Acetobacteraceae bacterium]
MTSHVGRRALAGAAALLPAAALVTSAQAQSGTETTFDRIRRTKVLRVAGLPGALPYFDKDLVSGKYSGACVDMANDIAKVFGAEVSYLDSTYGNSVLDLQSNKIDLAFALNPTPQRALSIGFTHAAIIHPFGCLAKPGLNPTKWQDLNKPDIRICFDLGSLHETAARRYCPKAQLTGYQTTDQCLLALQSGHQDVEILAALLGLAAVGKNASLGPYHLLGDPTVALPSCLGIQWEPDSRFAVVLNAWIDFNRGTGQIREWLLNGLSKFGVKREQVPPELSF